MILRTTAASPFGRKVPLASAILGMDEEIRIEPADTTDPNDTLRTQNPLGKLPALLLEDGTALFDSRVILEYLDRQAGGWHILPPDGAARFSALRLQALSDGILDAGILQVYEGRFRPPEKHDPNWLSYQGEKVSRALTVLETDPPALDPMPSVGQIALACALGYLDFRFRGAWRAEHPRLVAWLDSFAAQVPAFAETKPPG